MLVGVPQAVNAFFRPVTTWASRPIRRALPYMVLALLLALCCIYCCSQRSEGSNSGTNFKPEFEQELRIGHTHSRVCRQPSSSPPHEHHSGGITLLISCNCLRSRARPTTEPSGITPTSSPATAVRKCVQESLDYDTLFRDKPPSHQQSLPPSKTRVLRETEFLHRTVPDPTGFRRSFLALDLQSRQHFP
jgi:hypothetical protein